MNDDKEPRQPNPWMKSLAIWMGILLALVALTVMSPVVLRIWADAVLSVPLPVLP